MPTDFFRLSLCPRKDLECTGNVLVHLVGKSYKTPTERTEGAYYEKRGQCRQEKLTSRRFFGDARLLERLLGFCCVPTTPNPCFA
jgi:hypothetical protein